MIDDILALHEQKRRDIKKRLAEFKNLEIEDQYKEFLFCMLTPQSNAKKCWNAVEQISKLTNPTKDKIINILKTRTRFHNNKSNYILESKETWKDILKDLDKTNRRELRNYIASKVKGYGLKEASHFLRNIGKSDNQIAILDRHILRNLKDLNVIDTDKIKSKSHYFEIENKFIKFSEKIGIPIDELDLLFWSKENGEIFK